jgi:4-hydroxy-4-methyl-2-oxoglutarate aldolase
MPESSPTPRFIEQLTAFDTGTLHEAAGQRGAMSPTIQSLVPGCRAAGRALTAACPPGDNLMLHAAIAAAQHGDVIVAQCNDPNFGVWGEILTIAAQARGVVALVLDGSVRDIEAIRKIGFPVFARGMALQGSAKGSLGLLEVSISCGGVLVRPGDYVVGDDSGVVVLPAETVSETVVQAEVRERKEAAMKRALRGGATTVELLGLQDRLDALGLR